MANCNPGTRQYIGARYVPRHMGEWSADTQYSALDVVLYTDGNSYTAKCYPPKGTIPTDDKYWSLSAQFNQQLAALDDKVKYLRCKVFATVNDMQTASIFVGDIANVIENNSFYTIVNDAGVANIDCNGKYAEPFYLSSVLAYGVKTESGYEENNKNILKKLFDNSVPVKFPNKKICFNSFETDCSNYSIENAILDGTIIFNSDTRKSGIKFIGVQFEHDVKKNSIVFNNYEDCEIVDCVFKNSLYAISTDSITSESTKQCFRRSIISRCVFNECDRALYGPVENEFYNFGDLTVTENYSYNDVNVQEYCYEINKIDGLIFENNTIFISGVKVGNETKSSFYVNIKNNQIFESRKSGIILYNSDGSNIVGNTIVWPGEYDQNSPGIYFTNGNTNRNICNIANNNILVPNGTGIRIENSYNVEVLNNCVDSASEVDTHWKGTSSFVLYLKKFYEIVNSGNISFIDNFIKTVRGNKGKNNIINNNNSSIYVSCSFENTAILHEKYTDALSKVKIESFNESKNGLTCKIENNVFTFEGVPSDITSFSVFNSTLETGKEYALIYFSDNATKATVSSFDGSSYKQLCESFGSEPVNFVVPSNSTKIVIQVTAYNTTYKETENNCIMVTEPSFKDTRFFN